MGDQADYDFDQIMLAEAGCPDCGLLPCMCDDDDEPAQDEEAQSA